jgi:hypothetical protein
MAVAFGLGVVPPGNVGVLGSVDPAATRAHYDNLNLPQYTVQLIADRAVIDAYQSRRVDQEISSKPTVAVRSLPRFNDDRYIKVVNSAVAADLLEWWRGLPTNSVPPIGFRAPILGFAPDRLFVSLSTGKPGNAQSAVADVIARRLARDGLLVTLARAVELAGPDRFLSQGTDALRDLQRAGFPVDLLASFSARTGDVAAASLSVAQEVARKLTSNGTPESLAPQFARMPFRFVRATGGFEVAEESGGHALGMLRMQAGGGYQDGVVAGGSIDVINQMVHALAQTDFLISVPNEFLEPYASMARRSWRLRRDGQATLVGEPLPISAWAQDNGKAGVVRDPKSAATRIATLTPRFASIGEGISSFEPGESFLMTGLAAAGHAVAHSSLLFQGGNLLAVTNPASGERVLLMSDGTLQRNVALGLSREQVLTAFQSEFGVDRCVVLPAVSYHLDFDVTVRTRGKEVVALVNETMAAARIILSLGIEVLQRHGSLGSNAVAEARAALVQQADGDLFRVLNEGVRKLLPNDNSPLPESFSRMFIADRTDSGLGNFQTFLLALDLLESSLPPAGDDSVGVGRREYLDALRRMEAGRRQQTRELRKLGWTVVSIPSMTDLYRGINYLNGIQHRDGYIMPAFGGFYAPMDQAALAAIREALGPELNITLVRSAECQRKHGGIHCTVAAYPRL